WWAPCDGGRVAASVRIGGPGLAPALGPGRAPDPGSGLPTRPGPDGRPGMTAPATGREPAGTGFELVLAVVGGGVCVVVGIVAGGAWLATLLTGGSVSGGLAEWLPVAGRLASAPGDPAAAWGNVATGIPGPAVYWACTAVVLAAVLGVGALGWWAWR